MRFCQAQSLGLEVSVLRCHFGTSQSRENLGRSQSWSKTENRRSWSRLEPQRPILQTYFQAQEFTEISTRLPVGLPCMLFMQSVFHAIDSLNLSLLRFVCVHNQKFPVSCSCNQLTLYGPPYNMTAEMAQVRVQSSGHVRLNRRETSWMPTGRNADRLK